MTPAQFEWADEQTESAYRDGKIGKAEFLKRMSDLGYGPLYLNYLADEIDREKSALPSQERAK